MVYSEFVHKTLMKNEPLISVHRAFILIFFKAFNYTCTTFNETLSARSALGHRLTVSWLKVHMRVIYLLYAYDISQFLSF